MAFRDDLEAARQQNAQLRSRLREAEAAARQREQDEQRRFARREVQLRQRIDELERALGRARALSRAQLWLACWGPATGVLLLYLLAVLLAMTDRDAPAWGLCQVAIVSGILCTTWSWGRRGQLAPWVGFIVVKAGLVLVWGWGWWHPTYAALSSPTVGTQLYFFWCAPLAVFAVVLVEGIVLRRGLRPRSEKDGQDDA